MSEEASNRRERLERLKALRAKATQGTICAAHNQHYIGNILTIVSKYSKLSQQNSTAPHM